MFKSDDKTTRVATVRQRVWLSGESATAFNAIAGHRQFAACKSDTARLHVATRSSQAQHVQSLPKYATAALLWFATSGQHGFSPIHMIGDDLLLDYVKSDACSVKDGTLVIETMCTHPDTGRARQWVDRKDELLKIVVPAPAKVTAAKK